MKRTDCSLSKHFCSKIFSDELLYYSSTILCNELSMRLFSRQSQGIIAPMDATKKRHKKHFQLFPRLRLIRTSRENDYSRSKKYLLQIYPKALFILYIALRILLDCCYCLRLSGHFGYRTKKKYQTMRTKI